MVYGNYRNYGKEERTVNYYYDWTGDLSDDGAGGLVVLCAACARMHAPDVQIAQTGEPDAVCDMCEEGGDEAEGATCANY